MISTHSPRFTVSTRPWRGDVEYVVLDSQTGQVAPFGWMESAKSCATAAAKALNFAPNETAAFQWEKGEA
jgi:hypothetical protein